MNERAQRTLIFFAALIAVLLVVLIVMMMTDGDSDDGAVTTLVPTESETTLITAPAADADEPAGDEPAGDEPAGDEPAGDEPAGDEPAAEPEPIEVGRTTVELNNSVPLGGVDAEPVAFIASVGTTGFVTSHPWTMVSTSPPGMEGCQAAAGGGTVDNPIELQMLGAFALNWYGCAQMANDHVAQLHIILVEEDPDRVIVEIVVWDLSPEA